MSTLEIILSFLTVISGWGNLSQWMNIRAMREKANYEADGVHIEVLNKTIVMQSNEIERLQKRIADLEAREAQREKYYEEKIAQMESKFDEYAKG